MNPLLAKLVGAFVRWASTGLGAWLIGKGIVADEGEWLHYIGALLAWGLPLVWSAVEKVGARSNFLKALWAPAGATEAAVKQAPRLPLATVATKAVALLVIVGLASQLTACAARPTRDGNRIAFEAEAALQLERGVDALDALTIPAGNSPIDRAVALKILTVDEAFALAKGVKAAMVTAQQVVLGLKASLAARTEAEKQVGLNRASVLLRSLGDQLASLPITIGTEQGRKHVVNMLRLASSLLMFAGSIFPMPAPEGPPPSLDDALAFGF